jgi:hypothetical protein
VRRGKLGFGDGTTITGEAAGPVAGDGADGAVSLDDADAVVAGVSDDDPPCLAPPRGARQPEMGIGRR